MVIYEPNLPDRSGIPEKILHDVNQTGSVTFQSRNVSCWTDSFDIESEKSRERTAHSDDSDDSQRSRQSVVSESSGVTD